MPKEVTRIVILGFDALEYSIVENGGYPNLKQMEYGKVELNMYPINTEMIWASFITGEKPEKHGVQAEMRGSRLIIETLKKLSAKLRLQKKMTVFGRRILNTLRIAHKQVYTKEKLRIPTIFDYVDRSAALSIPAYNEWPDVIALRKMIYYALGNPIKEKDLVKRAWEIFELKKRKTLELLKEDWDLFMVHFYIADIVQHVWYYKKDYILDLYEKLDETAMKIKAEIPEDSLILIVSDHGMLNGLHTSYAFYSCNQKLNLRNPKITDFADLIRKKLGIPSKTEVEEIKKRLRGWGYV